MGLLKSVAFGDDVFEPVRVVHMNNGKSIQCRIGWLDGTKMVCQKFNGSVTLPLQSVDLEKTFPKFRKREGETILLIHPGQVYRDQNVTVSNLRMIRKGASSTTHNSQRNRSPTRSRSAHYAVLCEVTNRGDPSDISVSIAAKDMRGTIRHKIDLASESSVRTGDIATLRKQLHVSGIHLESQIGSLGIKDVERNNILEEKEEESTSSKLNVSPDKLREEKIRALKALFLKERVQTERP
jgi:hypothetical protein